MGMFGKILEKLGMSRGSQEATAAPATAPASAAVAQAPAPAASPAPDPAPAPVQAPAPAAPAQEVVNPIPVHDVVAQLEKRAAASPQKLNWRTSIVDVLKLLDLDSSLAARKELARELRCPDELMGDSAQMNMWLHRNVLAHLAANGGNIPKEMLD